MDGPDTIAADREYLCRRTGSDRDVSQPIGTGAAATIGSGMDGADAIIAAAEYLGCRIGSDRGVSHPIGTGAAGGT